MLRKSILLLLCIFKYKNTNFIIEEKIKIMMMIIDVSKLYIEKIL